MTATRYHPDGSVWYTWDDQLEMRTAELLARAVSALTLNDAYLAIPAPLPTEMAAQVASLTRQLNGIIRLATGSLSTTAGT